MLRAGRAVADGDFHRGRRNHPVRRRCRLLGSLTVMRLLATAVRNGDTPHRLSDHPDGPWSMTALPVVGAALGALAAAIAWAGARSAHSLGVRHAHGGGTLVVTEAAHRWRCAELTDWAKRAAALAVMRDGSTDPGWRPVWSSPVGPGLRDPHHGRDRDHAGGLIRPGHRRTGLSPVGAAAHAALLGRRVAGVANPRRWRPGSPSCSPPSGAGRSPALARTDSGSGGVTAGAAWRTVRRCWQRDRAEHDGRAATLRAGPGFSRRRAGRCSRLMSAVLPTQGFSVSPRLGT